MANFEFWALKELFNQAGTEAALNTFKNSDLDVDELEWRLLTCGVKDDFQKYFAGTCLDFFKAAKKNNFGEPIFDFLACLYDIFCFEKDFTFYNFKKNPAFDSKNGTGVNAFLKYVKTWCDFLEYENVDGASVYESDGAAFITKKHVARALFALAVSVFNTRVGLFTEPEKVDFCTGETRAALNFGKLEAFFIKPEWRVGAAA